MTYCLKRFCCSFCSGYRKMSSLCLQKCSRNTAKVDRVRESFETKLEIDKSFMWTEEVLDVQLVKNGTQNKHCIYICRSVVKQAFLSHSYGHYQTDLFNLRVVTFRWHMACALYAVNTVGSCSRYFHSCTLSGP